MLSKLADVSCVRMPSALRRTESRCCCVAPPGTGNRMWRATSSPPAAWLYVASDAESDLNDFATDSMKRRRRAFAMTPSAASSISFGSASESLCAAAVPSSS